MKSRKADQKTTEDRIETKKPRFKIEKLEERIAPHHRLDHHQGGGGGHGGNPGACHRPPELLARRLSRLDLSIPGSSLGRGTLPRPEAPAGAKKCSLGRQPQDRETKKTVQAPEGRREIGVCSTPPLPGLRGNEMIEPRSWGSRPRLHHHAPSERNRNHRIVVFEVCPLPL